MDVPLSYISLSLTRSSIKKDIFLGEDKKIKIKYQANSLRPVEARFEAVYGWIVTALVMWFSKLYSPRLLCKAAIPAEHFPERGT